MNDPLELHPEEKKKIATLDKRKRDRDIYDLKKTLEAVEGRRLVWRILSESGIFRGSFNSNALVMAFNEGKRDIGLLLLAEINLSFPQRLVQMQNEHASDQKVERNEREKILRSAE